MRANTTTAELDRRRSRLPEGNLGDGTRADESRVLTELRDRLLDEALDSARVKGWARRLVRLAALEAEARVWVTPFPLLLFPELFGEKAREVSGYVARQERLRRQSRTPAPSEELNRRAGLSQFR